MIATNTATIHLVPAIRADLESLVALRIEAMQESLERAGRFDPVRARERFASGFSPMHTKHIVINGKRIGFVVIKPEPDQFLLDHLYIRPDFQRQGIGSAVLDRIFAKADAQSTTLRVAALRGSEANQFYKRRGFEFFAEEEWDIYYVRYPHR